MNSARHYIYIMSFSIGIVGLPNVGKSTLFKALTKKQVDAANYPFCTIDPNVGTVAVPDERLAKLAALYPSDKIIPTTIEFVDIAGLVKGASEGAGLGNKFLAHIREVDAIVQVVRSFSNPNVIHVDGKVNPESDKETINLELIYADLQTLERRLHAAGKLVRGQDKEAEKMVGAMNKIKTALDAGQLASTVELTDDERGLVRELTLLTIKPMLYIYNVDEGASAPNNELGISAKIEAELSELPTDEATMMMTELGMEQSGLDRLIQASYKLLNLLTFFTVGPQEARAWTVPNGAKAPQAAGVIHTDFEKNFIRAEVIGWQELIAAGSDAAAKEKGTLRVEGKEYVMKDGDVVHFRHGA
jgi:GTP-binding protein YchF